MKKTTLVTVSLALLVLLLPAAPVGAQQGGPIYVVQEGDTLSGIARTFGTSLTELLQANSISNANNLSAGQELVLPGFSGVQGVLTSQAVAPGQSLNFLAAARHTDAASLARLNRLLRPDRLYVGQSIILPEEESAESEAAPGVRTHLVAAGEDLLRFAANAGQNPWSMAAYLEGEPRLWWVPGEWALLPAADADSSWLPSAIESMSIEPPQAEQGETVVVSVQGVETMTVDGRLADWDLNFVNQAADRVVALQGINALQEPGLYELSLEWTGADGQASTGFSQPYPIRSGDYGFDPVLIVPEETLGPENTEPEDALIAELVAPVTPEKLWDGPFEWPSAYFVDSFPSVFGTRRNYNNTGYNAYHTGLDFYGGIGIEILAPAPGEVVFSDDLIVRGLTTIIDHGWGVYSIYMHQSEAMVAPGEVVEPGQVIGLVGASGRVTGAHLHWEIRVGGVPVQPLDWLEQSYP